MDPDAGGSGRSLLREGGCFCGHARKGLSLGNHPPVPSTGLVFGNGNEFEDMVVAVGTPQTLTC